MSNFESSDEKIDSFLISIEKNLKDIKNISNDPSSFIGQYFLDIQNDLNTARNEIISKINERFDKFDRELEELRNKNLNYFKDKTIPSLYGLRKYEAIKESARGASPNVEMLSKIDLELKNNAENLKNYILMYHTTKYMESIENSKEQLNKICGELLVEKMVNKQFHI